MKKIISTFLAGVTVISLAALPASALELNDGERFATPEEYTQTYHLENSFKRGTSAPTTVWTLDNGKYIGSFKTDSAIYTNYLFQTTTKSIKITSDTTVDKVHPFNDTYRIHLVKKNTFTAEEIDSVDAKRNGKITKTFSSLDSGSKYYIYFSKAIDNVYLSGDFTVSQ